MMVSQDASGLLATCSTICSSFFSTCSTTGSEFWQELYDMNHKAESDLDGSITKAEFNVKMVISDVFGARDGPR